MTVVWANSPGKKRAYQLNLSGGPGPEWDPNLKKFEQVHVGIP